MKKILSACLSVLIASAAVAADAERTWNSEDTSPGIRVYNGYTDNISVQVGTNAIGNIIITDGTTSSNIMNQGTLTVADVVKYMRAYTNAAGNKLLTVDANCLLSADSTSNLFLVAAITNRPGRWTTAVKVDTSQAKFFSTYFPGSAVGGSGTKKTLTNIYGSCGGTSNITVAVYADGTKAYQRIIPSPDYRASLMDGSLTNDVTFADDVTRGEFDLSVNLPFGSSESVMIRATRSATATTGGIGASATVRE